MQFLKNVLLYILNFLVPEEENIKKLLQYSKDELKRRLPKPRSIDDPDVEALFDYRDEKVRTIIKNIKYKSNSSLIELMATYLVDEISEFISEVKQFDAREIIILPMPISKKRKIVRGWSQCELICKKVESIIPTFAKYKYKILKKIIETRRQTELHRSERLKNLKGSMTASTEIHDCICIVIDDVYTTGATFNEARRALKEAGAAKVFGFFLAH